MTQEKKVNPRDLIKIFCHAKAVIKVDSIYIGGRSISLQIKLAEANVERLNASSKRRLYEPKEVQGR